MLHTLLIAKSFDTLQTFSKNHGMEEIVNDKKGPIWRRIVANIV